MTESPVADELRRRQAMHSALPAPHARRALRVVNGLTLADVASAVGVTRAAVSNWERGTRTPRGRELARYLEALSYMREAAGR